MTRVWNKAPCAVLLACAVLTGPASAQFKPPEYQYTPPPGAQPSPVSNPDDYFRREKDYAKNWSDDQDRQGQQKVDQQLPWLKAVSDFRAPSTEQLTIGAAVLLFLVMGGILLWAGAGSVFRGSSVPGDAAKQK